MKYQLRRDYRKKLLLCKGCGLGGLTLVRIGAKIKGEYEHQTPLMCDAARRRDKIEKALALKSIRAKIKALKARLEV